MQKQNASIRIRGKMVCIKRCEKLMALKVHKRDKECMCSIKAIDDTYYDSKVTAKLAEV